MASLKLYEHLLVLCLVLEFWSPALHIFHTGAQLMWTPIYLDGKSQIDLWTQEARGCQCPWNRTSHQCACCVPNGGCHCGRNSPNRCAQCGLEESCNHMCNMTIVAAELEAKSGRLFGQIKSPSLEGPDACWYTFVPSPLQRVEVQIYRIVNAGKYNGTSCVGGYLQLVNGVDPQYSVSDNQICGINERYSPPVVFFADDGIATLLFEITDKTRRSLFLAYFSFTSVNNTDGLKYQPQGGLRLQNTDCDWLYQDFACNNKSEPNQCTLASPGYPGVYPPYRQCKYHITTSNESVRVRISFTSLLLPPKDCRTDYISIYRGSTTSSPLLTTLCGNQRKTLEFSGLNLLIEFSSGPQKPPFDYNGFVANLWFFDKPAPATTITAITATTITARRSPRTTATPTTAVANIAASITNTALNSFVMMHVNETLPTTVPSIPSSPVLGPSSNGCDILISGNNTRSGHFDTRDHKWYPICRLIFRGRSTDVVHLTFFNYRLRMSSCKSVIEVIDGIIEDRRNIIEKVCSPASKQTKGGEGDRGSVEPKTYLSSDSSMIITLKRPTAPLSTNEAEFLSGAYFFHDEQISGTMQPSGMCDVRFNGAASPLAGMVDNPGMQHLYLNVDGPLVCRQQFAPSSNQSVTIKIQALAKMNGGCTTQCGDAGCRCVTTAQGSGTSLASTSVSVNRQSIDHLMLVSGSETEIVCLCGNFEPDGLPVSVRAWGPLTLVYNVARYTWSTKGFDFSASYSFNTDHVCGEQVYTLHAGVITMKNLTQPESLNHFYHQSCVWTLHSNVERQLEINISSSQNRPCTAWNISIHEYIPDPKKQNLGELLHTFCSRDVRKRYSLPWKLNTVVVRLFTLSRTLPHFKIKWKSQVVRANTRFVVAPPFSKAPTKFYNSVFFSITFWLILGLI